jgi:hypothetical protein
MVLQFYIEIGFDRCLLFLDCVRCLSGRVHLPLPRQNSDRTILAGNLRGLLHDQLRG